jgi:hypothetical protein
LSGHSGRNFTRDTHSAFDLSQTELAVLSRALMQPIIEKAISRDVTGAEIMAQTPMRHNSVVLHSAGGSYAA